MKSFYSSSAGGLLGLLLVAFAALWSGSPAAAQDLRALAEEARGQSLPQTDLLQSQNNTAAAALRQGLSDTTTETAAGPSKRPFGANLFSGSFSAVDRVERPDYQIAPGDQIAIRLWGGVIVNTVERVDPKGNVFVPEVGPIQVLGVRARDLNAVVTRRVQSVFTDAVGIYATLVEPGSVGVFVTGAVDRPGRYLGAQYDSPLYFIDQAGGIDPDKGSYRRVKVLRGDKTLTEVDIYAFLIDGFVDDVTFQDGDAILVEDIGPAISVSGAAFREARFEFTVKEVPGQAVIDLARPRSGATHALVTRTRGAATTSAYLTLAETAALTLQDGDAVEIVADVEAPTVTVAVEGNVRPPHTFVADRGVTLHEILAQVRVNNALVDVSGVHLRRPSVAAQQKRALDDALDRLERTIYTAGSQTLESARLRAEEAALISQFVARARQTQPLGEVVVMRDGRPQDILLADGDVIVIPDRTQTVIIAGEVLAPGAYSHQQGLRVRDYLRYAGGFMPSADDDRFVLRRLDGTSIVVKEDAIPGPGDEILVIPKVQTKYVQIAKDILSVIFQIAFTTRAITNF